MPQIIALLKTQVCHKLAQFILKKEEFMPHELVDWAYRWYREH